MRTRLDLAAARGCDGGEPDNVDGCTQDSSFPLQADDPLAHNRAIANEARAADLRTLVLPLELDGSFRVSCDEP